MHGGMLFIPPDNNDNRYQIHSKSYFMNYFMCVMYKYNNKFKKFSYKKFCASKS